MSNEESSSAPISGSGASLTVRRAMHWEAKAINRLSRDSMRTYGSLAGIRGDRLESLREGVPDIVRAMGDSVLLVAVNDNSKIVGTVRLYFHAPDRYPEAQFLANREIPEDCTVIYLTRFAVLQSDRGRGIGSHLIDEAERIARSEGVSHILLHTALSNEAVAGFYQKRGFLIDSIDLSRGYPRALFYKPIT